MNIQWIGNVGMNHIIQLMMKNNAIYQQYLEEAKDKDVIFCGRLADYTNMICM